MEMQLMDPKLIVLQTSVANVASNFYVYPYPFYPSQLWYRKRVSEWECEVLAMWKLKSFLKRVEACWREILELC